MSLLTERITLLATGIANYIRDSINPRLLPSGGATNQILRKTSGTDYAVGWVTHKTVQYSITLGNAGVRALVPITVTISDADVVSTSIIEAWYSPIRDVADKEYEDDAEFASEIQAAKNALTNGAAAALDTLAELAAALGNDANFASTTTTALSNRLRFDAAQTLTAGQKTQACTNLGIGEPDTDFVSSFTSGLV